jgi:Raf kinase inhibitor-like YbhB/YbcL family protein
MMFLRRPMTMLRLLILFLISATTLAWVPVVSQCNSATALHASHDENNINMSRRRVLNSAFAAMAFLPSASLAFTISSPSFSHLGSIPPIHTRCDGDDISPPLQWSGVPEGTKSLALIVDDPDAPDPAAPKMTWVHWVLYNIPPTASGLSQGVSALPGGTKEAKNDWKVMGYGGPSPPKGTHRYFHKLYALDTLLPDLGASATKKSVEEAMKGHILGQEELVGTYKKYK